MGIERILASSERDFVAKSVDYIEASRCYHVVYIYIPYVISYNIRPLYTMYSIYIDATYK